MADSDIVVSGLVATPGFEQTFLEWTVDDPHYNGIEILRLDRVEVWAATSNDRGNASEVTNGITEAIHRTSDGVARWYWIRPRNKAGFYGDWLPLSPTGGIASAATGSNSQPGFLRLPSGLTFEWGFLGSNASGDVVAVLQRIDLAVLSAVAIPIIDPGATTTFSVHYKQTSFGPPITITFNVMKTVTGGTVSPASSAAIPGLNVGWLIVGLSSA